MSEMKFCYRCQTYHQGDCPKDLAIPAEVKAFNEAMRASGAIVEDPEVIALRAKVADLTAENERLRKLGAEAATYVESVICLRTDFTGESPYVGWKGLGMSLGEALDARDLYDSDNAALRARVERLETALEIVRKKGHDHWCYFYVESSQCDCGHDEVVAALTVSAGIEDIGG